ncbi:MAG: uracil-DNA glycosylase [Planctomycetota bacterium]
MAASSPRARIEHWIRVAGADLLVPRPAIPAAAPASTPATAATPAAAAPVAAADELRELEALRQEVAACTACALCEERTQTVFADGSPDARVMFVGEGPGREEDRQGLPFVGPAGQLLTRMVQGAMGLPRRDVYIANVVKCRPPGNRNPTDEEAGRCFGFLERQIALVGPEVLVCLGAATQGVGRLRGRLHEWRGIPVVVTWHPAYLLRNPAAKREAWDDVKLVLRTLGLDETPAPWREPG